MLHVNYEKWQQTPDDLRQLAVESAHPRTRERFLALYQVATKAWSASGLADETSRRRSTILGWVAEFVRTICKDACALADRLWVKDELDPDEEKVRFSRDQAELVNSELRESSRVSKFQPFAISTHFGKWSRITRACALRCI